MALNPTGFIPIPAGQKPGFDHDDVFDDRTGDQRIYVAHTGADRIDVIDCQADRYLRSIPDLPGVAGVLIDNEQDLLFSSGRGCAWVSVLRCSDESLLGQVTVVTIQLSGGSSRFDYQSLDERRHLLFIAAGLLMIVLDAPFLFLRRRKEPLLVLGAGAAGLLLH